MSLYVGRTHGRAAGLRGLLKDEQEKCLLISDDDKIVHVAQLRSRFPGHKLALFSPVHKSKSSDFLLLHDRLLNTYHTLQIANPYRSSSTFRGRL